MRWITPAVAVIVLLSIGPPWGTAADEPKTLKERLSDKASDEQRVDNCHVPVGRRGTKPRPDCPGQPDKTPKEVTQGGTPAIQPR